MNTSSAINHFLRQQTGLWLLAKIAPDTLITVQHNNQKDTSATLIVNGNLDLRPAAVFACLTSPSTLTSEEDATRRSLVEKGEWALPDNLIVSQTLDLRASPCQALGKHLTTPRLRINNAPNIIEIPEGCSIGTLHLGQNTPVSIIGNQTAINSNFAWITNRTRCFGKNVTISGTLCLAGNGMTMLGQDMRINKDLVAREGTLPADTCRILSETPHTTHAHGERWMSPEEPALLGLEIGGNFKYHPHTTKTTKTNPDRLTRS